MVSSPLKWCFVEERLLIKWPSRSCMLRRNSALDVLYYVLVVLKSTIFQSTHSEILSRSLFLEWIYQYLLLLKSRTKREWAYENDNIKVMSAVNGSLIHGKNVSYITFCSLNVSSVVFQFTSFDLLQLSINAVSLVKITSSLLLFLGISFMHSKKSIPSTPLVVRLACINLYISTACHTVSKAFLGSSKMTDKL